MSEKYLLSHGVLVAPQTVHRQHEPILLPLEKKQIQIYKAFLPTTKPEFRLNFTCSFSSNFTIQPFLKFNKSGCKRSTEWN